MARFTTSGTEQVPSVRNSNKFESDKKATLPEERLQKIEDRFDRLEQRELRTIEVISVVAALIAFGSLGVGQAEKYFQCNLQTGVIFLLALFFPFGLFALFLHYIGTGKNSIAGVNLICILFVLFSVLTFYLNGRPASLCISQPELKNDQQTPYVLPVFYQKTQ